MNNTLKVLSALAALSGASMTPTLLQAAPYQMENLGRGIVAVRTSATQAYIGFRLLGSDPTGTGFNLYRSTAGAAAVKLNASTMLTTTNFVDSTADLTKSNAYHVKAVVGGVEQSASASFTLAANAPTQQYLNVPLQIPQGGTVPGVVTATDPNPAPVAYTYTAGDCSTADLDGDGEYELVVKWEPTNAKDNSQGGYTGNVFLDAYKLNGTRLWRIDLGRNIRAGAHYTQFQVYDLDGDGKAEVACKTADATISGTGQVIGVGSADHRNGSGYILAGPEYLTVFNGQTGAIRSTVNYNPARGTVGDWGDGYGNRVDRFLAGVAYLDGQRPSLIMCRGYYTRAAIVAWDFRNGALVQRWMFDTGHSLTGPLADYRTQGAHSLSVADVDNDGFQEIIYGAAVIDHDGIGKHTSQLFHGDALHVTDINPNRPGLEIFMPHEDIGANGGIGTSLRDANTGARLFTTTATADVGRGCAGDIDSRYPGYELWATNNANLYTSSGAIIAGSVKPGPTNFMVWWDADLKREFLDGINISKWDEVAAVSNNLFNAAGASSNNGTKSTPAVSADILGDWREEVVFRAADNTALRIYTTTIPATNRLTTLMHDPQYRVAIAWQNTAYNQPPHPGFYLGTGMAAQPVTNNYYVGGAADTYQAEAATLAGGVLIESNNAGFNGTGFLNFPVTGGTATFSNVAGNGGGPKVLAIRYANGGTTARAGNLIVNGVTTPVSFGPTGAWTTYSTITVAITLNNNSTNTIQFASNGGDLGNIDQITVP